MSVIWFQAHEVHFLHVSQLYKKQEQFSLLSYMWNLLHGKKIELNYLYINLMF
jgi:hypothetical protein